MALSLAQIQQFKIDGYLVLPTLLAPDTLENLQGLTRDHLERRIEPFELEAQVHYPGAPENVDAQGGTTIRRLLHAWHRDPQLAALARHPDTTSAIQQILQCEELWLNPNHHNCVMTKLPEYSSETLWHRDTRYWNFSDKYLINSWFALGDEQVENGAMKVLPGSHRWEIQEDALDEAQFLKPDHPFNRDRLDTQRIVSLNAGDALLFSAHCFHAAGKNTTSTAKYSAVFTYHGESTAPLKGTHSDRQPEIRIR